MQELVNHMQALTFSPCGDGDVRYPHVQAWLERFEPIVPKLCLVPIHRSIVPAANSKRLHLQKRLIQSY